LDAVPVPKILERFEQEFYTDFDATMLILLDEIKTTGNCLMKRSLRSSSTELQ
jgi:hypothetical protein